jgi:hypothetical protein
LRDVTDDECSRCFRDGVVRLEPAIAGSWIDRLRAAVVGLMTDVDGSSQKYTSSGEPRFFSPAFARFIDPTLNVGALDGPSKQIAAQVHPQIQTMRCFYDHVLTQQPGTTHVGPFIPANHR